LLNPHVLDTTVVSLLLNRNPLLSLYQSYLHNASLCISFQTVAEMRFGALRAGWGAVRRRNLELFLSAFNLIVYSDELGDHWAQVVDEARRAGRRLEAGDAWIAATARLISAPLLTHDRDFSPGACPSVTVICHA
jgi:predicted nucleic acid-binding protein